MDTDTQLLRRYVCVAVICPCRLALVAMPLRRTLIALTEIRIDPH